MGQGNIVVFSFGTFFGKVFSKDRIPVADVLGCVVKGMSQVAGATFFHVSIAVREFSGLVCRWRAASVSKNFVRRTEIGEIPDFCKDHSSGVYSHAGNRENWWIELIYDFLNMPILEDLYNALLQQEEKEAHHVATALEIYVKGSLNLFNHRTNVNVNNRIVCYDIKELGKQLKKIGMLVVQDQVWNRVTINRAAHKSTRYYIDEMHLLLKEEQTAAYTVEIWKRFRKWGGIPTGITQNVKDLLSSREVENIFENSDFVYMLNQAGGDRQILAKQLGISTHQLSYVTHSGEGEGLLFYGSTILPFVDHFPKSTELYRIMTTKPQELKKKEDE